MPHTLFGFLILILSVPVFAQSDIQRASGAYQKGEYRIAKEILSKIAPKDRGEFGDSSIYLLAKSAEKEGDIATAVSAYQLALNSPLKYFALKGLARLARESGNLFLERLYLSELAYDSDNSNLKVPAAERLIRSHAESKDVTIVIELLQSGLADVSSDEEAIDREHRLLLAAALALKNETALAKSTYQSLIDDDPAPERPDDISLEAVKGLDRIENGGDPESVSKLEIVEHKKRAAVYQFNRSFRLARLHYESIISEAGNGIDSDNAKYSIARAYVQERNDNQAAAVFLDVISKSADSKLVSNSLYGLAGAYANLGQTEQAVKAYSKYISDEPDAANIERAYMNIVDAYRDAGDNANALAWAAKARQVFSGKIGESVALFSEAKIYLSSEQWLRAFNVLTQVGRMNRLGGASIAGGTTKDEVEFLRALTLEKLGRKQDASAIYQSIPDGRREYFGWRSTERLRALGIKRFRQINDGISMPQLRIVKLSGLSKTASILLRLGIIDEAAPEIERSIRSSNANKANGIADFDDDTAFTLANYYSKGGYADRAIQFLEPKWKKVDSELALKSIPKNQAEILYPVPFKDSLVRYGAEKNVDPRFLLSIMRQESRFQADIKSAAAARGLMQFISSTSKKMAKEMDINQFVQDDLYSPPVAIRFGSHYVSNLYLQFPGQHQAVAASYNGGEDRMERWLKRSKSDDPDRYVSEIVFSQTKDYVYKVMANYRMYQYLYTKELRPVSNPVSNHGGLPKK